MDKLLLVGINTYPSAPLSGCVNDTLDVSDLMPKQYQVNEDNIRLLLNERATKIAIMERLWWLVDGVKPGDRLYFHFSGHGSQTAERSGQGEVDQLAEIICPYDMAWDPDHYITDAELYEVFKNVPEGVKFNWASDSCHSGGLASIDRMFHNPPVQKARFWAPPVDIQWRINVAKKKGIITARESKKLNVGFVSGCRSDQTSADTFINGRPCGALTHYFLESLKQMKDKPFVDVVMAARNALKQAGYQQEPQAEGSLINCPFWGEPVAVAPASVVPVKKPCKRRWYFPWTWWCKG